MFHMRGCGFRGSYKKATITGFGFRGSYIKV